MQKFEVLKHEVLEECEDDHVGLWSIVDAVEDYLGTTEPRYVKCFTCALLSDFLDAGEIQAGFPAKNGRDFEPWTMLTEPAINRIRQEWDALGRDPEMGEIVWFTTPSKVV
ncbi:MAG TPA: hypothetical protein VIK18_15635 [Pirellulales bacterium]